MMVMETPGLLMRDVWTRQRRKILAEPLGPQPLGPQPLAVLWRWGGADPQNTDGITGVVELHSPERCILYQKCGEFLSIVL